MMARDPFALTALAFLVLIALAAIFAPLIAPDHPNAINYDAAFQLPSAKHLLGTDELGRDLLSRLIYGGRVSLLGVVWAVAIYLIVGIPSGLAAGYRGGWLDGAIVWLAEVSFSLPQIVIVLAVLSVFSGGTQSAMIMLGLMGAPGLAVMVRGATMGIKREQYIAAARASGLKPWQIVVRHVFPRTAGTIVVQATFFAGIALIFQTGLEFLGLGAHPPTASWGAMVADASRYIARDAWMIVPPGLVITATVISLAAIGDLIREARGGPAMGMPLALAGSPELPGLEEGDHRAESDAGLALEEAIPFGGEQLDQMDELDRRPSRPSDVRQLASRSARAVDEGALLWVRDLSISAITRKGARPLVEGVSFEVPAGGALGIVGESGCGKTLTTLALTGLLPPPLAVSAGRWAFDGRELQKLSEKDIRRLRGSKISMISQEPVATLDPSFTIGAQIAEVARAHLKVSRRQAMREAVQLLEDVRLPEPDRVARKYPYELSGGMAQRASIAAALAGRPSLLIADEPTTALDPTVQADILDLLRRLRAQNDLAVILVSHDWGVIADLCDSVVVMYAGQVVETADVHTLFGEPAHPYTLGLIESNPHYATRRRSELPMIKGSIPQAGNWPAGCHFAPRCPFSRPDCLVAPIAEQELADEHWARCIHPRDAAGQERQEAIERA